MQILPQLLANSLIAASLYLLVALGFNLIYSTVKFFDLGHGALSVVGGYNENHKTAIFVVEHNIKSLLEIASRAYVLDKGQVAADAAAATLVQSGMLERVFMGK